MEMIVKNIYQGNSWTKLVDDEPLKAYLENKLLQLDELINEFLPACTDAGLYTGLSGYCLLKTELGQYYNDVSYIDQAEQLIDRIFDILELGETAITYASGLAGIGMMLNSLSARNVMEIDMKDVHLEFAPFIKTDLTLCLYDQNFDLLYGAIGHGIYMINANSDGYYTNEITILIDCLEKASVIDREGRRIVKDEHYRETNFTGVNMGMAHGLPSMLVFLAKAFENGIEKERTLRLFSEFFLFLVNHQNEEGTANSFFPNFITEHPLFQDKTSRQSWCYGDLGIGIALLVCAKTFRRADVYDFAVKIFDNAAQRNITQEAASMIDPFFCHGTGGIAHLYNRAYYYTGRMQYREASFAWLRETQIFLNSEAYLSKLRNNGEKLELLSGVAGLGLILLSMLSDNEPQWDTFFLLS